MFKKMMVICLIAVMVVSSVACSKKADSETGNTQNNTVTDSYKDDIEEFIQITYFHNCSEDTLLELGPTDLWQDYINHEREYNTIDEILSDKKRRIDERKEKLKDEIEDRTVSYEIIEEKKIGEERLNKITKVVKDRYDAMNGEITEAYDLSVEITVNTKEETEFVNYKFVAIKYNNSWYLLCFRNQNDDSKLQTLIESMKW